MNSGGILNCDDVINCVTSVKCCDFSYLFDDVTI